MADKKEKQYKKFQTLDEEWRTNALTKSEPDLNKAIRDVAVQSIVLELAKEADQDLAAAKEAVKTASEQYKEGKKRHSIEIEFLVECLRSRGANIPSIDEFLEGVKADLV